MINTYKFLLSNQSFCIVLLVWYILTLTVMFLYVYKSLISENKRGTVQIIIILNSIYEGRFNFVDTRLEILVFTGFFSLSVPFTQQGGAS